MTARAVHWHEGMFLRPQQFQAAERHAHELLARNSRWDLHHGWGLHRVEWEPEALATYRPQFGIAVYPLEGVEAGDLMRAAFANQVGGPVLPEPADDAEVPDQVSLLER